MHIYDLSISQVSISPQSVNHKSMDTLHRVYVAFYCLTSETGEAAHGRIFSPRHDDDSAKIRTPMKKTLSPEFTHSYTIGNHSAAIS